MNLSTLNPVIIRINAAMHGYKQVKSWFELVAIDQYTKQTFRYKLNEDEEHKQQDGHRLGSSSSFNLRR